SAGTPCTAASAWPPRSTPSVLASTWSSRRQAVSSTTCPDGTSTSAGSRSSSSTRRIACSTWDSCRTSAGSSTRSRGTATLLFSATMLPEIEVLSRTIMRNPARISVSPPHRPPTTIRHEVYPVPQHLKTSLLVRLLGREDMMSVLVFVRTKRRADRVARQVGQAGFDVARIHGDRSQSQRETALAGFRSGRHQILIATDVAARGIDVEGISHVINYDIPTVATDYVHRVGR